MVNQIWQLQLFAGEGAPAGDGAASPTGVENADAGHQRLRELGVPAARIRNNREYLPRQGTTEAEPEPRNPKMTWDEVRKDPEYSAEISKIVRQRLGEAGAAREALDTLSPWLKTVAREQGMDPDHIDYHALVKSASGEYERSAKALGTSKENLRQLDQQQRLLHQQAIGLHLRSLEQQGQQLKASLPQFDLVTELRNPTFARLVSPQMGLSVEDAYHAVHRKEIQAAAMQVAAQKTAQQISNAIRSGSRRPEESGGQAPSVTTFDPAKMSKADREALKKRIYRGERILPGQS